MRSKLSVGALTAVLAFSMIMLVNVNSFAAKKKITIKGSTTVQPIAQACAEAFMNQHSRYDISVQGGGSGVGIASLIDGTCDIADASRAMKEKEKVKARQNGIEAYENVVAMDGIAVVVHPSNPITALTIDQIKAIYTGQISNWKDLGGENSKIVIISRDSSSGTFETFNKLALKKAKVRPDALLSASNQAVAQTVARTPGAVGYIGMGYLSSSVKAVVVNSIMPTEENVLNGLYKLARELYMYTNGKPKGLTKKFIDFVLSKEGQRLVKREGFVPLD